MNRLDLSKRRIPMTVTVQEVNRDVHNVSPSEANPRKSVLLHLLAHHNPSKRRKGLRLSSNQVRRKEWLLLPLHPLPLPHLPHRECLHLLQLHRSRRRS